MSIVFRNSRDNKVLFVISGLTAFFWLVSQMVNVYYFAVAGAIFEILALPSVVLLFALAFYSFYAFWKDNFNRRSLALYSAFMLMATIFFLISLG